MLTDTSAADVGLTHALQYDNMMYIYKTIKNYQFYG